MHRFFLIALFTLFSFSASAATINGFASDDDEWGCKVLLCIATPNATGCRPPIDRLWRHLARGHPFPTCSFTNGSGSAPGTYVQQGTNVYDLCPQGTTALPSGQYAVLPADFVATPTYSYTTTAPHAGIGDGSEQRFYNDAYAIPPPKICVAGATGRSATYYEFVGDEWTARSLAEFTQILVLPPNPNDTVFDIYVNGSRFARTRWGQ
jgi:hypothetical protein